MTGHCFGGILRAASWIAYTTASLNRGGMAFALLAMTKVFVFPLFGVAQQPEVRLSVQSDAAFSDVNQPSSDSLPVLPRPQTEQGRLRSDGATDETSSSAMPSGLGRTKLPAVELESHCWDFARATDKNFDEWPDGWQRVRGRGFPSYVRIGIVAKDLDQKEQFQRLDTAIVRRWPTLRSRYPWLPSMPMSLADLVVDRYLRIQLDGGQAKVQSPSVAADRMYQYRFSCQMKTEGLRHDSAHAELVFLSEDDRELVSHRTRALTRTSPWQKVSIDLVRPPKGAVKMVARLVVARAEDGLEDIRGEIGFDDICIEQYPQLQISTDRERGIYRQGKTVAVLATVMGVPSHVTQVNFELRDNEGQVVLSNRLAIQSNAQRRALQVDEKPAESEMIWELPHLEPGFYRVNASLVGASDASLATETTFAVLSDPFGSSPQGVFGWTMPEGNQGMSPRKFANWLASLGVAWVKYPCWIPAEDTALAEEVAEILSRMQDVSIQTVGMLDRPPEDQFPLFSLTGRRDLVAAQLFRDASTWQPLLEPVMTRLTLKVRMWQLGGDRDYSFLGRPRLPEAIREISDGLQGFGQPINVAISWPWLERELPNGESSWQAVCRSSDPPLEPRELNAFLKIADRDPLSAGPQTWLLTDPIDKDVYDRDTRIRDLVLRMATVRSHEVQAAFVSNPHHPHRGLLRPDGRPDELLLPWRTTSSLIGNMKRVGTLQLRNKAQNSVFIGSERSVVMMWSEEPSEERLYFGNDVKMVDVWGNITELPVEYEGDQPVQRIPVGRLPVFIIGADPMLLAFRMSVEIEQEQLDSLLGQVQKLSVTFTNPTRESLVGQLRVKPPTTWSLESSSRPWEALAGRSTQQSFNVVLSNTTKIGKYEVPIQFELETSPPKLITAYREVSIGPKGLDITLDTRLTPDGELRVAIVLFNHGTQPQSYDFILFPPPGRQYKRRFLTIPPDQSVRHEIFWPRGSELIGQKMLLRAVEQDGQRVLNYGIIISR